MSYIQELLSKLEEKNRNEPEFLQAAKSFISSLEPTVKRHPEFVKAKIYERIIEPDRIIVFRVVWLDDNGDIQINRGYRVQFNNAIGPYKGGLRFHPSVNISIMKFLAFEQVFKNSLTNLPMGGAKGGSDFDPKGKSDNEVMRFCYSFMSELYRYIGDNVDIPAGDIGVGQREIGYMFGFYKKIMNKHSVVLTGKGIEYGGSLIRPEATGYGLVYFVAEMLATINQEIKGKTVAVSGAGNVAQYTIQKVNQFGGRVITVSDSNGTIIDEEGIDDKKLSYIMELKNIRRGRIREYLEKYPKAIYFENKSVWDVIRDKGLKVDIALPCATQNEINRSHAEALVKSGCICVAEGANMPSDLDAKSIFIGSNILFGPSKAANAGGVAVSGLEITQNIMRLSWSREEVDSKLISIIKSIHKTCLEVAQEYGNKGNYLYGANIAGFIKVARAMLAYGTI